MREVGRTLRLLELEENEASDIVIKTYEAYSNVMDKIDQYLIYPYLSFKAGIKNCFRFFKVIWRFRGWDHSYTHQVLVEMMKEQEKAIGADTCWQSLSAPRIVKQIKIARTALQRIADDNYLAEEYEKLYDDYPINTDKCEEFSVGKSTFFRFLDEPNQERLKRSKVLYEREKNLKAQDWEFFVKYFRRSEGWWT
jgi:hypothetical protein